MTDTVSTVPARGAPVDVTQIECLSSAWNKDDCPKSPPTFPGAPLPNTVLIAIGTRRSASWMLGFIAAIVVTVLTLGTHASIPGVDMRVLPLIIGAIAGVAVGAGLTYLAGRVKSACDTYPDQVKELRERVRDAIATLAGSTAATGEDNATVQDVVKLLCGVLQDLEYAGPQWLDASGFLELWKDVHEAESSLVLIESETDVLAVAMYDLLRLKGSTVPNRDALMDELKAALALLSPGAAAQINVQAAQTLTPDVARRRIQNVRRGLNEFREQQWAQIVRSRNGLLTLGALAAGIGYLLVILAVGFSAAAGPLGSALVFALVAALVSEANQLQFRANAPSEVEDFGFNTVKAYVAPALAGVVAVLAVAFFTQFQLVFSGQTLGGSFTSWQDTFNWRHNPTAFAVAILVGFAPSLFFTFLQNKANDAISGIKSTQASGAG